MKKDKQIAEQNIFTEFLLYTTPNGKVKVEIFLRDETVWLTQYLRDGSLLYLGYLGDGSLLSTKLVKV